MEVKIIKYDHLGNGLGKIDDKVVFVKRALKDEVVDVNIIKTKKSFMIGEVNDVIKSSPNRIKSICPYYDKCGGCNFLHSLYDEEIDFKKEKAKELLGKVKKFYETMGLNYRNKVTLHVSGKKVGYYKEKTNQIIDIDYCYLLNNKINNVLKKLNSYVKEYDHDIHEVVIRTNEKELLMSVVGSVNDDFLDYFKEVDNIIIDNQVLKGNGYLIHNINDYELKLSANSFYQVNKQGLESIYEIIINYLSKNNYKTALDLYSGISMWGILVSNYVEKIISIEENSSATDDALFNKENNKIDNLEIINGRVEDYIDKFNNIDLMIIDPPRSGLDNKTKEYLASIKAKNIIYISCDMFTLQRDLKELKDIYEIEEINLVDMFKRTYHVESVVMLKLR